MVPFSNKFSLIVLATATFVLPTTRAELVNLEPALPFSPIREAMPGDKRKSEALKLYGLALLYEHQNRFVEAARTLEEASRQDPNPLAIHKALIPLLIAIDRRDDALKACRKVLELDKDDYETWYFQARQLRDKAKLSEASQSLEAALRCTSLKNHPDIEIQLQLDLGILAEEMSRWDIAIRSLHAAAKGMSHPEILAELGYSRRDEIDQKAAETYERLIKICVKAHRIDTAIHLFEEAEDKKLARSNRLFYLVAQAYDEKKNFEKARYYLEKFLRTQPPGSDAYELFVSTLKHLDKQAEVLSALKEYAKADSHNISLQLLLARSYFENHESRMAERLYLRLANESPTPEVFRGLLRLYAAANRPIEILNLLDRSLGAASEKDEKLQPGAAAKARSILLVLRDDKELTQQVLPVAIEQLHVHRSWNVDMWRFLGALAARAKHLDEAEQMLRECLGKVPVENEREVYASLLQVLWEARKYDRIVEVCQFGLNTAQGTNRLLFHTDLARAFVLLERPKDALEQAETAVRLADDSNRLFCHLLRVRILGQTGGNDKAAAECRDLLKDFHQPEEVHKIRYALANIYSNAKLSSKAEEQLLLILKDSPGDISANNDLGYMLADQGKDLEEAESMVRKAIDLDREQKKSNHHVGSDDDEDSAAYIDSLGWVLFREGKLMEAMRELEKATHLHDGGQDPVIWDHLGDVYLRLDETEKAQKVWRNAVKLYDEKRRQPDDTYRDIKQKLKLLEMKP